VKLFSLISNRLPVLCNYFFDKESFCLIVFFLCSSVRIEVIILLMKITNPELVNVIINHWGVLCTLINDHESCSLSSDPITVHGATSVNVAYK